MFLVINRGNIRLNRIVKLKEKKMTYSQKIAVLTDVQNQMADINALSISDADVYREAWAATLSQIAQKISTLWHSDLE